MIIDETGSGEGRSSFYEVVPRMPFRVGLGWGEGSRLLPVDHGNGSSDSVLNSATQRLLLLAAGKVSM